MPYGNSSGSSPKKKRLAMIGVASILLMVMVFALGVWIYFNEPEDDGGGTPATTVKAVKSMCQATDYKRTCYKTVSKEAGNTTDTRKLIKIAFEVAMKNITKAAKQSETLRALQNDPRTRNALTDCKELMDDSISELQHSLDQMGALDITKLEDVLDDLKVWLSAATTYQETCLDGFKNTTGDAAEKMKKTLNISRQMTSNSLAIVNDFSSVLTSFNLNDVAGSGRRRRLLKKDGEIHVVKHANKVWASARVRRLLEAPPAELRPQFVVAQDGSGNYKTIGEALEKIPRNSNKPIVIYVKAGVYEEVVEIGSDMRHVCLVGDGAQNTRITASKNFVDGVTTYRTASFAVKGDFFMAKNIGFENSSGPEKHQAVALRVQSDMSIFYNCSMDGYEDTLYAHTKRQFYRGCTISGTIDFVFGDAAAVFQNCSFLIRNPKDKNQNCIVTASGRKDKHEPTGLIIQNSTIGADKDYDPNVKSFLGRPWREFSRTIIMESYIENMIDPEGWLAWEGELGVKTCYYAEVDNHGPGSDTSGRVKWSGVREISKDHVKDYYTAGRFIQGDRWVKDSGVPYTSQFFQPDSSSKDSISSSSR